MGIFQFSSEGLLWIYKQPGEWELQLDHFWIRSKGVDRGCPMFKAEHSHQIVINGVHTAQGSLVFFHHSSSGFPAEIFFYFPFHTDPGSFMHAADFYFAVFLHLLIYFFLIICDNVEFSFSATSFIINAPFKIRLCFSLFTGIIIIRRTN